MNEERESFPANLLTQCHAEIARLEQANATLRAELAEARNLLSKIVDNSTLSSVASFGHRSVLVSESLIDLARELLGGDRQ